MKAGILKNKIKILASQTITSEYGEKKNTWYGKYITRANVKFKSQDRTNPNSEIYYNTTVEFKMRYYVDINEWDRIEWKGKVYKILSLLPNQETQEIIAITEKVNE